MHTVPKETVPYHCSITGNILEQKNISSDLVESFRIEVELKTDKF